MTTPDPRPASATNKTHVAAFFDLDKTIIATSSAFAFGKKFLNSGLISPAEAFQMSLAKASYMMVGQSSEKMDSTRDQLSHMVAGWEEEKVAAIVNETMHQVVTPAIYAEARELIESHKKAGHQVIIVSASASTLVRPIAKELGVELIASTELEVKDGKYTGEILFYCKGEAKAQCLRTIAARENIDLAQSFAYSDSGTDIPMLEMVGNPITVNPDRSLKKHAADKGWEVKTFKDPVPLFTRQNAKEIGLGASVLAGTAAILAGALWLSSRPASFWVRQTSAQKSL